MNLNKLQALILTLLVHSILNDPIEIENFGKYHLIHDTTKFVYHFNPNILPKLEGTPVFLFGIFESHSTKIWIYEDDSKQYTTKIEIYSDNKFYGYKIKNITVQKYTFEISSWGADFIFIDNTKEINTTFIDFLNLNLDTSTSYEGPSYPIIFNINSPAKSITKFSYYKENFYNSEYMLEYCSLLDGNKCEYKGINTTAIFEKGVKYKIKYNCYIRYSNNFEFTSFSSFNTYEIEFSDFNFYQLSSNHIEEYFLLNIKNFNKFSIYIEADINDIYTKYINETDSENIEKIKEKNSYESKSLFYGDRLFDFNNLENDYIVIKIEYSSYKSNKGTLAGFSTVHDFTPDTSVELEKGEKVIIKYSHDSGGCILVSSSKNMKKLDYYFDTNKFIDLIRTSSLEEKNKLIFVDSSNEKTKILMFKSEFPYYAQTKLKLYFEEDIKEYLDEYGPDSLFMRMSSHSTDFLFNVFYIYGFKEKYYLYIKRHYGNINFYKYNFDLNKFSDISKFETPYYHFLDEFNLIKDDFLEISGFQIFTFYNSYNSLLDFYFQKINDSEYININQNMFKFNNLVKLLEENKLYYLNFTVDHIIKLDNKFLEAEITFTDNDGKTYFLNKENKVIKNLTGDNFTVISTQKALIYFYKKINDSKIIEIEFDKTQTNKVMKFNITNISGKEKSTNINIIKDFGFSGYYPMISERSWDKISGNENQYTVYIENFYDKITKEDLYEKDGEKLVIYIYPINKEEFEISNITYVNNLLTKKNKYNMEVIPPNSTGVIILNVKNLNNENYQFEMCNSKEIKFTIDSSNGNFSKYVREKEYPFIRIIKENTQISFQKYSPYEKEILIHSFESDNEFLFSYTFNNYILNPFLNNSILSIFEIQKNILQIKFNSISDYLENYYILIAKKDDINNIESFSNKCYISKLFINDDFNSILVKKIYKIYKGDTKYILDNIDISELNLDNNAELVVTVISSFIDFSNTFFKFYSPKEINKTIIKEIHFEEETYFNLENNSIFQFEYNHNLSDREQKLSIFFNGYFLLDIILTHKDEIKRDYYNYNTDFDFILTDSGKYYLEIYKSFNSIFDTKEGTFILLLTERLIDIIDLSEREYKNDKMIKLPRKPNPNYYIVNNLKKDKQFNFTFEKNQKKRVEYMKEKIHLLFAIIILMNALKMLLLIILQKETIILFTLIIFQQLIKMANIIIILLLDFIMIIEKMMKEMVDIRRKRTD